jgi:histidinol phosphatase-like PHP family hydrolase
MYLMPNQIDLHIHTNFSDGTNNVPESINLALKKNLKIFAITDHYSEFTILPKRIKKGQINAYLNILKSVNVIKGIEVDILDDCVSISKQKANLFDMIIGGLHILNDVSFWGNNQPIWNYRKFVEKVRVTLIKAVEYRLLNVIAHPTWLPEEIRPHTNKLITKEWIKSVVNAAANQNISFEINCAWKVPNEAFILECLRQGVKLSIGSDSHNTSMIGKVQYAVNLLKQINAPLESLFIPNLPLKEV